jgi:hypothetical protein
MTPTNFAIFLEKLKRAGYTWDLTTQTNIGRMGKVKYVDAVYDTRSGHIFALTFRGMFHGDQVTFSSTNNTMYWDVDKMAWKWCQLAHRYTPEHANAWYERLGRWGMYRMRKQSGKA